MLLVHSGSRGLGQSILRAHTEQFGHKGLVANTEDANEYLQAHNNALDYAKINRRLIGERMMRQIRTQGEVISDVNHNLVEPCELHGQQGWLHRKVQHRHITIWSLFRVHAVITVILLSLLCLN